MTRNADPLMPDHHSPYIVTGYYLMASGQRGDARQYRIHATDDVAACIRAVHLYPAFRPLYAKRELASAKEIAQILGQPSAERARLHHCLDCGKQIGAHTLTGKCYPCSDKSPIKKPEEPTQPKRCLDCLAPISPQSKRCPACALEVSRERNRNRLAERREGRKRARDARERAHQVILDAQSQLCKCGALALPGRTTCERHPRARVA